MRYELTDRMQKNYLLLLGFCSKDEPDEPGNIDYMLKFAHQLVQDGDINELFDYVEPDIIRKKYYAWEYPDDAREYGGSGYY